MSPRNEGAWVRGATGRWKRTVSVAVVALAVIVSLGWWVAGDRGGDAAVLAGPPPESAPGAVPAETSVSNLETGSPPTPDRTTVVIRNGESEALNAQYEACVIGLGFDPGGLVQVVLWEPEYGVSGYMVPPGMQQMAAGTPIWVKTGNDIPASVHRPCLLRIGGADPLCSSHCPNGRLTDPPPPVVAPVRCEPRRVCSPQ